MEVDKNQFQFIVETCALIFTQMKTIFIIETVLVSVVLMCKTSGLKFGFEQPILILIITGNIQPDVHIVTISLADPYRVFEGAYQTCT